MRLLHRIIGYFAAFTLAAAIAPGEALAAQPADEELAEVDLDAGDDDDDDDDDDDGAKDADEGSASSEGAGSPEYTGKWGQGGEGDEDDESEADAKRKRKAADEVEEPPEQVLPPAGFAYLDTAIGFGDITVVQYSAGAAEVTPTASFLIALGYTFADAWQVYARFPISTGESNGPREPFVEGVRDPDAFKQIALGSLEIGGRYLIRPTTQLSIPAGLAVAMPTGQGDMFADVDNRAELAKRIVNQAAAASRGYEERALFASKRLSITPSTGLSYRMPDLGPGTLRPGVFTKFEIMIATGGVQPDARTVPTGGSLGELKDVAFNWVLGGDVWYDLFGGYLSPGLRMWMTVGSAEEINTSIDPGGTTFAIEPSVATHVPLLLDDTIGLDARLGYMVPVAGEIGGDGFAKASIGALRLMAGAFF